jgi:hypothetical protein
MALINLVNLAGTSHDYTGSYTTDPLHPGTYGHDENWATYQGCSGQVSAAYSTHIFDKAYTITKISFHLHAEAYAYADHEPNAYAGWAVEYWNGAEWVPFTEASSGKKTTAADPDVHATSDSEGKFPAHDVIIMPVTTTKIRAYATAGTSGYGNETKWTNTQLYEIQAYADFYGDSGIRYYGNAGVVRIGYEPLTASHKVRAVKNILGVPTVVGIPLVSIADVNASPWRIWDGTGIKALAKCNL